MPADPRRWLLPLAALLFLTGCPEEVGLGCPPGAGSVGQFALNFAGQHPAGECVAVSVDGGDAGIGPLALDDGGQQSANLCFGPAGDGGSQLSLVIPTKGVRVSRLSDAGEFSFDGSTPLTNGTACICPVGIAETLAGRLVGLTPDAGFAPQSDGGLPPVISVQATLKDTLTAGTPGDPTCICTTPCTVTYTVNGTR
jgi:hypothetical protein